MRKARFIYLSPKTNAVKLRTLEALQEAYTVYLRECVDLMLAKRRFKLALSERRKFFPTTHLSSQIAKNAQAHAVDIVSAWAASKYVSKLRTHIRLQFRDGAITEEQRHVLCIIGKCLVDKPYGKVTQEALDTYWTWLLDNEVVGTSPTVTARCGMRMSEMTATLANTKDASAFDTWLGFSHLDSGKRRVQLPLAYNPYVKDVKDVSKGILARKDKQGRWRFEVIEIASYELPPVSDKRLGVDVGLNCMAATSNGDLLGTKLKPKFDTLYGRVKSLRANRQRQGLKENSPRLDTLESKLSGLVKTAAGEVANKLVLCNPDTTFVIEDLDLRGCSGQKRFAYKAVHKALQSKANVIVVNPAYTSQLCPSCGYVAKTNRAGVKFNCRSCGRKSHADFVGGLNLLRRSEDKQIQLDDDKSEVRAVLKERYESRKSLRTSSSRWLLDAPEPSGQKLTVKRIAQLQSSALPILVG